jgi:hypothetical protein
MELFFRVKGERELLLFSLCVTCVQRLYSKRETWCIEPYAFVDYNLNLLNVNSKTCTMGDPMPESTNPKPHCNKNPISVFPEKELRDFSPYFHIHVCIYTVYSQGRSTDFPAVD